MRVGIAGVGGIGSNVAVNLVRSGLTQFTLVDFDRVEMVNLDRQFYFKDQVGRLKVDMLRDNLMRINPELDIQIVSCRIDASNARALFSNCVLVVEGLDKSEEKKMLLESCSGEKVVVMANGIAGDRVDTIKCRRVGNCTVVGDFITDCCNAKLYAHKIQAVAAFMTEIVLRECR